MDTIMKDDPKWKAEIANFKYGRLNKVKVSLTNCYQHVAQHPSKDTQGVNAYDNEVWKNIVPKHITYPKVTDNANQFGNPTVDQIYHFNIAKTLYPGRRVTYAYPYGKKLNWIDLDKLNTMGQTTIDDFVSPIGEYTFGENTANHNSLHHLRALQFHIGHYMPQFKDATEKTVMPHIQTAIKFDVRGHWTIRCNNQIF